jgi:transcriptional regulator with XRE-family HTH domain
MLGPMGMFRNLGRAISLLREMRGYSQMQLSRSAKIGKSQLSKYEKGRELPKLETLERVLRALEVEPLSFFYTLAMLDDLVEQLDAPAHERPPLPPPNLPLSLLQPSLGQLFSMSVGQLVRLYHLQNEVQASPLFQRITARPRSRE